MTWRPVPATSVQQADTEPIARARLRLRSGSELSLSDVRVRSDSVVGYAGDPRERRAFPSTDVASIERRQLSVGRTAGVVIGVAAVTTFVIAGLTVREFGNSINAVPVPRVP